MRPRTTEFLVIFNTASNALRVCPVPIGFRPAWAPGYTWGGPFPSSRAAQEAILAKSERLYRQLHPKVKSRRHCGSATVDVF